MFIVMNGVHRWIGLDAPRGRKGRTPNERRHRAVEQVMKMKEYLT